MGESKRRRDSDPLYGVVPKAARERGLVISNPMTIRDSGTIDLTSSLLDRQELRFSLLYWDKLAWPRNNVIWIAGDDDSQFLESAGVLLRPEYRLAGGGGNVILEAQLAAFRDLDSKAPGTWAIAQGEKSLQIADRMDGVFSNNHAALLELHRAIPIPTEDVPLAEILEFKLRRKDELFSLRKHFEDMAAEISASEDASRTLSEKLNEVDQVCADLLTVSKEWQFPVKLGSLNASISFEPTKTFVSARNAFVGSRSIGLSMGASSVVAGLAGLGSVLNFKPSGFALRGIKRPRSPYRYAYHIETELK